MQPHILLGKNRSNTVENQVCIFIEEKKPAYIAARWYGLRLLKWRWINVCLGVFNHLSGVTNRLLGCLNRYFLTDPTCLKATPKRHTFLPSATPFDLLDVINQLKKLALNHKVTKPIIVAASKLSDDEKGHAKEKMWAEIALNSITDAVICTNLRAEVDYLNASAVALTGWSREDAYGLPITQVFNIVDGSTRASPLQNPVLLVLENNTPMGLNAGTLLIQRCGKSIAIEDSVSPIRDLHHNIAGVVIVFHDVSVANAMTQKMAHLAQHDYLTNLPNRLLLNDRITHAITHAKRNHTKLAVLFLDLDHFKIINDSLGHETGDMLLKSVAERLISCVRNSDTVSRQGGDEFVILLTSDDDHIDPSLTAQKILNALHLPHKINHTTLHITTTIGMSLYPDDGLDAQTLIKNADTAMYDAKDSGRNHYQFFKHEMNVRAVDRQMIESHLRLALERHEFALFYQPKVNLKTGQLTGAEALLRWRHHEWGITTPNKFIKVAEHSGLIIPIGHWVMREACLQIKRWMAAGLTPLRVAVNISAIEFHQVDFIHHIKTILAETQLEAKYLQLEITESVLIRDAAATTTILHELREMQIEIALDDFGTGYSSLSYLNQFPIDVLKIDQSFVCNIHSTIDEAVIVSAIIGLGNNLNMCVVAEGIENKTQLEFLKTKHCAQGQGDFFSPPLDADELAKLLASPHTVFYE